jgi:hypothetical protein
MNLKRKKRPMKAPRWWLTLPDETQAALGKLKGVSQWEIGRSAGGHPILAAAWGAREDLPNRTSLSLGSALAGGSAAAFYGEGERKRQTLLFIGNAHGIEFEGTVAAVNMLSVLATGKDLRGRRWPRMHREGRKLRVVVIPTLNVDGRMRHAEVTHFLDKDAAEYREICQGDWKTGEKITWPKSKLHFPIPPDQVKKMGGYFNDCGVNLVYDTGLGCDPQPETAALLRLCREEMPDCAVCSHTNRGSLVETPDSFVPSYYRQRQVQIGAIVGARCLREGVIRRYAVPQGTQGYAGEVFYQTDLIYHACGALPLLVEFPAGYKNFPYTFHEVLDIGMCALEEILGFGAADRFRPHVPQHK